MCQSKEVVYLAQMMVSTQEKGHSFYYDGIISFQKERKREKKQPGLRWTISDKQEKPSVKLALLIF